MNRAAIQLSTSLTFLTRANFSKMLRNRESNPIKERVMSTPTWPVPYYQRVHRAYPVRCNPILIQNKNQLISQLQISNSMTPTGTILKKS